MTSRRILRRRQARIDIDDAIDYYLEGTGDVVALGFVDALDDALRSLATHPEAGSSRYADGNRLKGLRFWPLQRFPYLIFYFDLGDTIDVWRVLHASRDIPRQLYGLD